MAPIDQEIAVTVLAGGDGSRIGGLKPLRLLAGRRLIDHALDLARSYSSKVAVSVRNHEQLEGIDAVLIEDDPVEGPIGGVIAGSRFARATASPLLLLMPVDTPFLPRDFAERLKEAIGPHGCAIACSGGKLHPACSLWRVECVEKLSDYLATGRRSLGGLAAWMGFAAVEWSAGNVDPFFNINTPDDLTEAEKACRRG
jgi:molybdopterin-guanine dinucleotide biosynthesis protein A